MAIATLNDILPEARRTGRAVGAFNIANYETAKAVVMAAEAEGQPVIVQVYQRLLGDPHIAALAAMMRRMAEDAAVPVVVHLDHGASLAQVRLAVEIGFSSIMLDGSQLPLAENIAQTMKAVEHARKYGLSVEGEIGHVPLNGAEGTPQIVLSTPAEAAEFARATGVDALAVSIGTAHGYYAREPEIAVELAAEINRAVGIPLVLHGGSGTPADKVRAVIRNGFAKVNVATEFQHLFSRELTAELQGLGGKFVPLDKVMQRPVTAAIEALRGHIRFFAATE